MAHFEGWEAMHDSVMVSPNDHFKKPLIVMPEGGFVRVINPPCKVGSVCRAGCDCARAPGSRSVKFLASKAGERLVTAVRVPDTYCDDLYPRIELDKINYFRAGIVGAPSAVLEVVFYATYQDDRPVVTTSVFYDRDGNLAQAAVEGTNFDGTFTGFNSIRSISDCVTMPFTIHGSNNSVGVLLRPDASYQVVISLGDEAKILTPPFVDKISPDAILEIIYGFLNARLGRQKNI